METAAQICTKITDKNQIMAAASAAQKPTDTILHERFKQYGKNAREWTRKCALLLPEIAKYRIWEKKGFENIYEYARILAGMSVNAVNAALWTMRKLEDKPELKHVVEEKGISAVRPIANLATKETAGFWAEKAMNMSSGALMAYAKEFKKSKSDFCFKAKNCYKSQDLLFNIKTEQIIINLKPETADQLKKLKGQEDWEALMQKLLQAYQVQMEAQKPAPIKNAKRYIPVKIKRYALERTGGSCAFPGCQERYGILHHTQRFALTHEHNPNTLMPLCKAHERLAHLGLIENEEKSPSEWRVRTMQGRTDKTAAKFKIDQKVQKYRTASG